MESQSILIVDDDEITRSFLSDILAHEGFQVSVAENGRKALERLKGLEPDLIISDVLMPEVGGLELFRRIQEEERLQNLPFIFLTSMDDGEALIHLKELGPDDYLQKPVRPRHLVATVRGKLRRKQRREEQQVRDQDKLRDRIRWTLSHELRTPLTIIQGISEILLHEGSSPAADHQELLQNLRLQSFQLGSLIENFLLVTRIDAGVEEETWSRTASLFPLREVLDEAAFPLWERARARQVEFRLELAPDLPAVHLCRAHLLEALKQVLDNAFKFADPVKPCVVLRADAEGGAARVVVSDNGQGIPAAKREFLFQKLSQVDREIHEQQGSGLGLYIAKRLMDINRGAIELRSEPGRGAELELRLPTAPPG